jgi:hypothetical protein
MERRPFFEDFPEGLAAHLFNDALDLGANPEPYHSLGAKAQGFEGVAFLFHFYSKKGERFLIFVIELGEEKIHDGFSNGGNARNNCSTFFITKWLPRRRDVRWILTNNESWVGQG